MDSEDEGRPSAAVSVLRPPRFARRGGVLRALALAALGSLVLAACAAGTGGTSGSSGKYRSLSGAVTADGSSTVFPITQAVGEEFQREAPEVRVSVGTSGTGGGFEKFCRGETDISNASRPIKDSEKAACQANGVSYVELQVAIDGLSVIVNPQNRFASCLTVQELKKVWAPGSTIKSWKQVRADFPDQPIRLYGPGTDSGTFDFFTEAINGKSGASRSDYTASEDDNVLVRGVEGDPNALGYFGYAYYAENKAKLRVLGVDGGNGCVSPTARTINDGSYKPLSRPLFVYVNKAALGRPQVVGFMGFYLDVVNDLVADVGYIPVPKSVLAQEVEEWEKFKDS